MTKRSRPFLVSLAITFLVGYGISDVTQFVVTNYRYYQDYNRERSLQIINYAKLGLLLLKHEEATDLGNRLEEAVGLNYFDFYLLKKNGQVISFANGGGSVAGIDRDYVPNQMVQSPSATYLSVRSGEYTLTIGLNSRTGAYLSFLFRENRGRLAAEILLVVLMAVAIAFYYFRDIRQLVLGLRTRGRRGLAGSAGSLEAEVMRRGLESYERSVSQLRARQTQLSRQVSGSIRTELDSGKTPPYDFRCVMVRTDINQYSTIISTHPVGEFMEVINEFFTRASRAVEHYRGFVTEFVGDEIIYYFKEEDHANAAAVAVAAIRDLNRIAEELHARTIVRNGYPFRVKSAAACGSLHFGHQVDRFALSGGVFVETVRILSEVEEKEENSVYLPARLASRLEAVATTRARKVVKLRGIPGDTHLHRVEGLATLASSLGQGPEGLVYFRNAEDVATALQWLEAGLREGTQKPEVLLSAANQLRENPLPYSATSVREAYIAFLTATQASPHFKLLGVALTMGARLLSRDLYEPRLRDAFRECLSHSDPRVAANAVEAFTHFDPGSRDKMFTELARHPNNRVLANALIKTGMVELSREVVRELTRMLQSGQPLLEASGAFALGELTRYYLVHDPVFFETSIELKRLLMSLPALAKSKDEMVRRQAKAAMAKAQPSEGEAAPRAA